MGGLMAIIYGGLAIMPLFVGGVDYMMHILIMILIWAVVASCWDLIMGFAGIFSFGQVAFFVIGAYASAIVSNKFGIPPFFSIFIAGGIAAILGVLVGLPCLRLKGAYVALVTFAVHMILEPFLKGHMGRAIGTGGSRGILTIPPINIFGYAFTPDNKVAVFYLTLVLAVICSVIILMVIRSFWGTAFLALKDSEDFSASLGVSAFKYKLAVFALTSFLTGMVGGFYAHYVGMLSTRMLGIDLFVTLMIMLVIGGIGQFPGAILGAIVTVTLNEMLSPLGPYRPLILGGLVVVLVLLLPDGVIGLLRRIFGGKRKTREAEA
ncbi:amino acid/amide ABC transporter membrane protein 2, HAAT family [Desulfatibacillum alkenivorans DSM 16219]|uniref:Amino acid/amide ABC transporter membrane protein 2, HAAT family n=2 Tax=Desulfatibacillum alkenivorans TaxID=259354 RepID=A0A1M6V7L5_9BACT|nr:amino acid/amide ABC transporter membrane protein 2, HAAT family [Desulfatibacillum alkenivorans DSM 16219]